MHLEKEQEWRTNAYSWPVWLDVTANNDGTPPNVPPIYVHIPKTAGLTLKWIISRNHHPFQALYASRDITEELNFLVRDQARSCDRPHHD